MHSVKSPNAKYTNSIYVSMDILPEFFNFCYVATELPVITQQ